MKFRTEVIIKQKPDFISSKTEMILLGSCFAEEIGKRLEELSFPVSVNPAGIIFNPVSLADLLDNSSSSLVDERMLLARDDQHYHYGCHSKVYGKSKDELIQKIKIIQQQIKTKLTSAEILQITFGTAWAYRHLQTNNIVANCHKIPQKEFSKELLDLEELKQIYLKLFTRLFEINPKLQVLLTVSPVRHIKDGIHENNLSKSILLLLSDYLVNTFSKVSYFPAYELIVDDLRDYRFYKEDLIHPTNQAVDYVFEKFSETYFSNETRRSVKTILEKIKLDAHWPLTESNSGNG